jgi:hypothetical protein
MVLVWPSHLTSTMLFAIHIIPLVISSIGPPGLSFTLLKIINPVSLISAAICVVHCSLSIEHVISNRAYVPISICKLQLSLTIPYLPTAVTGLHLARVSIAHGTSEVYDLALWYIVRFCLLQISISYWPIRIKAHIVSAYMWLGLNISVINWLTCRNSDVCPGIRG